MGKNTMQELQNLDGQKSEQKSDEEVCDICGGSGEVSCLEEVEYGNPQTMADVGSRKCLCQMDEDEGWE